MELKAYKDILDGVKDQETVKAIPEDWIDSVGTEFTSRDARAINAMMIKWRTNPDLPKPECSEDACDL